MIRYYIKVAVAAACVSSIVNICTAYTSFAQQSQLQQQIKPFECIYTTTQTGAGSNMDSTCDGQPVPLLMSVDVNSGRPILHGMFSATQSLMLRIWINGQWYTLGVDPRLTVMNDNWKLDFSELTIPLQPGMYTVMVEAETNDGLLLRNTNAGSFIVPVVLLSSPPTRQTSPRNLLHPGFFIPTILPRTQEGTQAPATVQTPRLPVAMPGHERDRNSEPEDNLEQIIYAVISLAAIVGAVWAILYFWRHHKANLR